MGTNFKLQVVKQSEDAEDEAVAVFQPKGPAPATNDYYNRLKSRFFCAQIPQLTPFFAS